MAYIPGNREQRHEFKPYVFQDYKTERVPDGKFLFFSFYKDVRVPVGKPITVCGVCGMKKRAKVHQVARLDVEP